MSDGGATATNDEDGEVEALTTAVFRHYGFDFRHYAPASLRRRLVKQVHAEKLTSIGELHERLLADERCMERLLTTISVTVSSMFRDPEFFAALRERVLPTMRTYPTVNIWVAGCAGGEEVYSLAIVLLEEGLYEKSHIFATDMNDGILARARRGVFPLDHMRDYTLGYQRSGPRGSFSDYYTADSRSAIMDARLTKHVTFTVHNLATDGVFNEFQLILCRNVMIYFDRELQTRVVGLFHASLCKFGLLALGRHETLRFSDHEAAFEGLDVRNRIYRRKER